MATAFDIVVTKNSDSSKLPIERFLPRSMSTTEIGKQVTAIERRATSEAALTNNPLPPMSEPVRLNSFYNSTEANIVKP